MLAERIARNAWAKRTVQSLFRENCRACPGRTAIEFQKHEISYAQLQAQVDGFTQALLDAGVGADDVVSILPAPTPDFAVAYFAVLQVGAVLNPFNLMWDPETLSVVMQRNAPRVVITVGEYNGRNYVELLQQCLDSAKVDHAPEYLLVNDAQLTLPDGFARVKDFMAQASSADTRRINALVDGADPDSRQFICQTSGSTGFSKSALWRHRTPLSTAHFLAAALNLGEQDRWINLAPFFHNSGICCTLAMCLGYIGCTVYLSERFDPDAAVRTVQDHGIAATFGFGAHWHAMRESRYFDPGRFGMNKALLAGDAALYDFVEDMLPADSVISNLYAQTENGPLVSLTEPGNVDRELRRSNSGRPMPGVQVKICDIDSDEVVPDGVPGEIRYTSPYLFCGYLTGDGGVRLPLDDDGFFQSGDYGFMSHGYLTYIERLGGVVKSGGENVSLARVSVALAGLFKDEFKHLQAVAIPDPYWGDRVVGVVQPGTRMTWTTEALRARAKTVLSGYEVPRNFVEWKGAWPVSPEGKLDVKKLRQFAVENVSTSEAR